MIIVFDEEISVCAIENIEDAEEVEEELQIIKLVVGSVTGLTLSKTMKVFGKLEVEEVIVLIDIGASPNFVSQHLAVKW